jgi:hypothetical protein
MKQGTAQFYFCCPVNFARQYRIVIKSIKKCKGNLLTLTEEPNKPPLGYASRWGLHKKCAKEPQNISRCTITYEVPK